MSIKKIFYFAIAFFSLSATAQTNSDAVRNINSIKSDTTFICAESTVKDWKTAYENARLLLTREIEDWLIAKGISNVAGVVATSNEHILEIKTTRGSLYRAFVYVKKSDLLTYTDKSKVVVVDVNSVSEHVVKIEADGQLVEESTKFSLTPFEKELLFIKESKEIEPFIKEKMQSGTIEKYGRYANMPSSGTIYLFIYNKEGKVPACLKSIEGLTVNLTSGKQEDVSQTYKGCGAIWFQI